SLCQRSNTHKGTIPKKLNDPGHVSDLRRGSLRLPIANSHLIHPDLIGNPPLKESKVEPLLSHMIAYCLEFLRILSRKGFWSFQGQTAKRQRSSGAALL